jgi:hypothetical protein
VSFITNPELLSSIGPTVPQDVNDDLGLRAIMRAVQRLPLDKAEQGFLIKIIGRAPPLDPNTLLTVQELAAWWGCSVSALNKGRLTGIGPRYVKLLGGNAVRYRVSDCLAYIAARTVASTSAESQALVSGGTGA